MDSDGFSVLQNSFPCRNLHGDGADAFPGERVCHTSLKGDYRLLGGGERDGENNMRGRGGGRGESQSLGVPMRDPYQRLVNISHCCYLH